MKPEKVVSKIIPTTCNLHSSGGCAFEALTAGDIQGLFMSCDATPLIWSLFEAKYQMTTVQPFEQKLVSWVYNRLQGAHRLIDLNYLAKRHATILEASQGIARGVASYLARHKVKDESKSPHFRPISKSVFDKKYKEFANDCIDELEHQLGRLEYQIKVKTENE